MSYTICFIQKFIFFEDLTLECTHAKMKEFHCKILLGTWCIPVFVLCHNMKNDGLLEVSLGRKRIWMVFTKRPKSLDFTLLLGPFRTQSLSKSRNKACEQNPNWILKMLLEFQRNVYWYYLSMYILYYDLLCEVWQTNAISNCWVQYYKQYKSIKKTWPFLMC